MRTKTFFILPVFLFVAITIQAKDATLLKDTAIHQVNIQVDPNKQVVLRAHCVSCKKRSGYILKVYSDTGNMVYASSYFRKGAIYKSFDLNKLPEGKYEFKLFKGLKPVYSRVIAKGVMLAPNSKNDSVLVVELAD